MPASALVTATAIAGVAHRRHGLDVVPVAVGLEHLAHAEVLAQISSSASCSLAASIRTASPVCRQRRT